MSQHETRETVARVPTQESVTGFAHLACVLGLFLCICLFCTITPLVRIYVPVICAFLGGVIDRNGHLRVEGAHSRPVLHAEIVPIGNSRVAHKENLALRELLNFVSSQMIFFPV